MLGPIFQRELLTVPRRWNHYVTRAAYLGGVWVIAVTAWLALLGWSRTATLGELGRFGALLYQLLTYVMLALFLFFSALAAASSIAREKDRRTFVLLLMTDLRDTEIVLGKVLGSLLPILVLELATLPMLLFLLMLGGIGLEQVLQTLLVFLGTTLAAGALGGLIALWRERTFQSLALTVLVLAMYIIVIRMLAALLELSPATLELSASLRQWLEPLGALASVHAAMFQPPDEVIAPAYIYFAVSLTGAILLTFIGVMKLRVWNPSGEPIMQRETPADVEARLLENRDPEQLLVKEAAQATASARADIHAAPGVARPVVGNPIFWREVYTRAYGRRPLLVKLSYAIVLVLICYSALGPLLVPGAEPGRTPGSSLAAALGLLPVGVLSLLLVTAQASTAITSERDTGALDLLLVTDLSPKEFIFGKLLGILYNTKEYLLPPLLLAGVYGWLGYLATPPRGHPELLPSMNAVALLCVLLASLVLLAFATVLGIHVALRTSNSQLAIVHSLSTIFFLTVGTLVCIALILINRQFEYQWGSFVFFLIAGVGGLWYVLSGDRPTPALTLAAWACPLGVLYTIMAILVGRPGTQESADPLIPTAVITLAFGFTIAAMLVPLLSEFDVAMGRTSGGAD